MEENLRQQPERETGSFGAAFPSASKRFSSEPFFGPTAHPAYHTAKIYTLAAIISEFGIDAGPLFRLAKSHSKSALPEFAVIACSGRIMEEAKPVLAGRKILMLEDDFDCLVSDAKKIKTNLRTRRAMNLQGDVLALITAFLENGNSKPA